MEFAVLYFNTQTFYPINKPRLLIIWIVKPCTWSWNHLSRLQRNAKDRFLFKPVLAEGLAVETQLRDIVVQERVIILFRDNSPGLTPEGECLSPGEGNFRNVSCVAFYFALRQCH